MNAKIVVGIVVGIAIVIGLGYGFSDFENNPNDDYEIITENDDVDNVIEPIESEGTQFTIELSDSVKATGP